MNNIITINSIQRRMTEGIRLGKGDEITVRRLWWAALDTLQDEILPSMEIKTGLWLASPLPALYDTRLLDIFQGWVWAPEELATLNLPNSFLLPPSGRMSINNQSSWIYEKQSAYQRLTLRNEDGHDPLLIIITPQIQVALALQGDPGHRNFLMRSDVGTIKDLLSMLDLRLNKEEPDQAKAVRDALHNLGELRACDNFSELFWPSLSKKLAVIAPSLHIQTFSDSKNSKNELKNKNQFNNEANKDISLLEALTHEVRTPLATIRTLIRSLLRRDDLSDIVNSRLKQIDSECTEQIDRFGLIFNAVELERAKTNKTSLASTDLGHMLKIMHPYWSKQLERRGLKLNLDIESDLPHVLSDSEKLELMLGGLIDKNSRGLHPGASLTLKLRPAGLRLKLQIFSQIKNFQDVDSPSEKTNADLGPVLSWNPNTGSLQLSQGATQRLLASLGGRLANRKDNGLTVFFPIAHLK